MAGEIRCGKLTQRSGPRNKHYPSLPGFTTINVSSSNRGKMRNLSPMVLGPFIVQENLAPNDYYPNGILPGFEYNPITKKQQCQVKIFENYWQGSKIYINLQPGCPSEFIPDYIKKNIQTSLEGKDLVLSKNFFERRGKMFHDPQPYRRDFPKEEGCVLALYFDGHIMSYIPSRLNVYCPHYAFLAEKTPEYQELKDRHQRGENLLIVGYDGRDVPITIDSMKKELINEHEIFGHELVLCCLLMGWHPWEDIKYGIS